MNTTTLQFFRFLHRLVRYIGKNDTRVSGCKQHFALSKKISAKPPGNPEAFFVL